MDEKKDGVTMRWAVGTPTGKKQQSFPFFNKTVVADAKTLCNTNIFLVYLFADWHFFFLIEIHLFTGF